MLDARARVSLISDLNMLFIHDDMHCLLILPASCIHILLSGTRGPKVTEIGTTGGDGCDVRITCVHGLLMLCSGTLLKGVP